MHRAFPSTTHLTSHPGGANLWAGSLTENEKPLTFDHAAIGAKALAEVGGVEVALRTAHKAITRLQTNSLGYVSFASKLILSIPPRWTVRRMISGSRERDTR